MGEGSVGLSPTEAERVKRSRGLRGSRFPLRFRVLALQDQGKSKAIWNQQERREFQRGLSRNAKSNSVSATFAGACS